MDAKEIRNLHEAYLEVYGESAVGDRARRAVENQRGGFHGDDDAMNQAQKGLAASMERLKKTPTVSYVSRSTANRAANEAERKVRSGEAKFEQVDVYDVVLSHLLDEGYADTQEAAESIMANMTEDWRNEIVEAHGRRGYFNTVGQADRTGGRYKNLGSPTDPKEIEADEARAAAARARYDAEDKKIKEGGQK